MESSYDIVESSCYILYDCSQIRTTEIDLNSGAVMANKKRLLGVSFLSVG